MSERQGTIYVEAKREKDTMYKWTATIEDNQGEGLVYTFTLQAVNFIAAADAAQERCDDNYENMEVVELVQEY